VSDAPIDLFGGLQVERKETSSGGTRARVTVEFTAPTLVWHADEKAIAGEVARAIEETIRANLLAGRAPDGSPLPAADSDTLDRRQYRVEQAARGGEAAARITDSRARSSAKRNWTKRFKAPKLGHAQPIPGAHLFGVESSLLARSVVAVAEGGVWRVFFTAIRARLDRTGQNAVLRVFKRVSIWNAAAMSQPRVQQALRNVQKNLLAASAAKALAAAAETLRNLSSLQEELEDDG
jgi:hypothetical protein